MIYLDQTIDLYQSDFRQMIQAFFPGERIVLYPEGTNLTFGAEFSDRVRLSIQEGTKSVCREELCLEYQDRKRSRNQIKAAAYRLLSRYTGKELPWGSMTGVRPTKFATARMEAGWSDEDVIREYETVYLTTRQKGEICCRVARREQQLLKPFQYDEEYCLYIGIPFCPSRCLYCSFASYPADSYGDRMEDYLKALKKELCYVADVYREKRLTAVYMGGGTPTALSAGMLQELIGEVYRIFDTTSVREFTVEAGRPDSLNEEKLAVMKRFPVSRISINPQTMRDETLRYIGRNHTAQMTVDAYNMAREYGFDNINMDIIAGLPTESQEVFEDTLHAIEDLKPDSLTVHSLAVKRSARLNIERKKYQDSITGSTDEMLNAADMTAKALGMEPYYLYRQKNMAGNFENVGYAKEGKAGIYNILIMEEVQSILALGAGASTKFVYGDGRIERVENVKDIRSYLERLDEMIERKRRALEEYKGVTKQ